MMKTMKKINQIKTPTVTPEPGRLSREEVLSRPESKAEVELDRSEQENVRETSQQRDNKDQPETRVEEPTDNDNDDNNNDTRSEEMSCRQPQTPQCPTIPVFDKEKVKELVSTEISLEKQLECVQNQLLALKQLPSEIENHLRIVSEQLHKIMELSGVQNGGERSGRRQSSGSSVKLNFFL